MKYGHRKGAARPSVKSKLNVSRVKASPVARVRAGKARGKR